MELLQQMMLHHTWFAWLFELKDLYSQSPPSAGFLFLAIASYTFDLVVF
jgi:hypothetical protein